MKHSLPSHHLGEYPVQILHPNWSDRHFVQFGGRLGSKKEPIPPEDIGRILSGDMFDETRGLLRQLGFLLLEVRPFRPREDDALSWDHLVNDRRSLPDLNMIPHTDFADVVLYVGRGRKCRTGISGRSGIAEALQDALPALEKFDSYARLCIPEIRFQILNIIEQSLEYDEEEPLIKLLQEIHRSFSYILAFEPSQGWPFLERLYASMRKRKVHHSHVWSGHQILMVSSRAFHFREIPQQQYLTEAVPTWRAQIDHHYE